MKKSFLAMLDNDSYRDVEHAINNDDLTLVRDITNSPYGEFPEELDLIRKVLETLGMKVGQISLVVVDVEEVQKVNLVRVIGV